MAEPKTIQPDSQRPAAPWVQWPPVVWAALLVALAAVAYSNSFAGPFIFDDQTNVIENAGIRRLWPPWDTMWAPLTAVGVAGRPVAQLSLAINYAIHGLNLAGYHAGNLILHVAAAVVLFGVARRALLSPPLAPRFATHATPLAFAVAIVWEVHPLLCDSVSYISARTEVLAGLFLLLTLYCAIRATSTTATRRARRGWCVASVVSCALGMGSKEVMVAAPLVVLAYDWLFAPRRGEGERRWRAGFYVALFATLLLVALNLRMANFHRSAFAKVQDSMGAFDYLKLQSQVIVHYLRLCFWPEPLLIDYSGAWGRHPTLVAVLPQASFLVLLLAATVVLLIRRRPVAFVGVWFFAILAPTSSLLPLPTEIASERRMYLPLIAVVALVVLGGYAVLKRVAARQLHLLGAIVLALVVAAETSRTLQRNAEFKDPLALWSDVLVRQPGNRRAYANLARELLDRNQDQAASEVYRKMLGIDPNDPATWNNLAAVSIRAGDWPEAERCLRAALTAKADFAPAHQNLGLVYLKTGRLEDAEREVREAIRLDGNRADRSALLTQIQDARTKSPTSLPANSSPSPPRP
jgi:tetratricopeptide (TPR) repeat protein